MNTKLTISKFHRHLYCLMLIAFFLLPWSNLYANNTMQNVANTPVNRLAEAQIQQYSKIITLNLQNVSLSEALKKVAEVAGIGISYNADLISGKTVTVNLKKVTIKRAMKVILSGTDLEAYFSQKPEIIFVRKKKQNFSVKGKVTDSSNGEPLPGVNVYVKGTTIGVATDAKGRYALTVPSPVDTLMFSYIGYKKQMVPVNNRRVINVSLVSQTVVGQEMVVVGYATQQAKDVSGSISTVSSSELNTVATTSVNSMLQGKAAGLNLTLNSNQPGGASTVNIRGALSPHGNNAPLYVVDGVPLTTFQSSVPSLNDATLGYYGGVDRDPLDYLNPSDIQSVTVLKGAAAAAIYGSSAANGVILITTKRGRAGNVKVNYTGNYTIETPQNYFPMLGAKQFMEQQNRLGHDLYLYDNKIAPYGNTNPGTIAPYNPLFAQSQINAAGRGTNWTKMIMRNGYIDEHNISLSGGNKNMTIYSSFNFLDNNAILKTSNFKRYTGRINLDEHINNYIDLSIDMTASQINSLNAATGSNAGGAEKYNMIQAALNYTPTVGVFDKTGNYTYSFNRLIMNPAAFLIIQDNSKTNHFFAAPKLKINFTKNLEGEVNGGIDKQSSNRSFYLPRVTNNAQLPDGMAQKSNDAIDNYSLEGYLTYNKDIASSHISIVAGAGYYKTLNESFGLQGVDFFTDAFSYNNVGVASNLQQNSISSFQSQRTKLSQFFRINYSYRSKYIINIVGRRDGSSIFAANKKYGFFPGISAAWRISQESFMKSIKPITELKLRAGYGEAGNESILVGNSLALYNPGYPYLIGTTYYNGVAISQVANPNLTWETDADFDVGLDFGLFNDRINGSADYYIKTARNLLDYNQLPYNNAVGRIADNVGSTQSKGFELTLHTVNISGRNFRWTSDLDLSTYNRFWLKRNPKVPLASYIGYHDPIGAIYGWKTDGIIKSKSDIPSYMPDAYLGNIKYVDLNGDGKLDSKDVTIIGNYDPKWTFGFNNTFSYKNFDLIVYVYGRIKQSVWNDFAPNAFNIDQTNPSNTTIYAKDVWSSTNPNGTYPGVASNPYDGNNPTGNNNFNLEKVSFLRLSNITLGYTLPTSIFNGTHLIRSARLFVNVKDLGVLTNFTGFDPEYSSSTSSAATNPYPKFYSYTFGINIHF